MSSMVKMTITAATDVNKVATMIMMIHTVGTKEASMVVSNKEVINKEAINKTIMVNSKEDTRTSSKVDLRRVDVVHIISKAQRTTVQDKAVRSINPTSVLHIR